MENEQICTLCLVEVYEKNFEVLGHRIEMLKTVLIDLDLPVQENSIICRPCSENLEKCFDFKKSCLKNEHSVEKSSNLQDYIKVKKEVCCLCFSLNDNNPIDLNEQSLCILKKCIPELNLDLTQYLQICLSCLDSLQRLSSFITSCSIKTEKINYCFVEEEKGDCKEDLNETLQFADDKFESDSKQMLIEEETLISKIELFDECGDLTTLKTEKYEETQENGFRELNGQLDVSNRNPVPDSPIQLQIPSMNYITSADTKTFLCKHCTFTATNEREFKIHYLTHDGKKKLYECSYCPFVTFYRDSLTNHQVIHKNLDEIEWQHCSLCPFRGKTKRNLNAHMRIHKANKRFKCEYCNYKARLPSALKRHSITHKKPEELVMFKCKLCTFASKYQCLWRKHINKVHLKIVKPQTNTFTCLQCNFTTKLKSSLRNHMLIHQKPTYKCSSCSHKTNRKDSLMKHELIHKKVKKVFKCDECKFETNQERFLIRHKLAHTILDTTVLAQALNVDKTFKCENCNYQTKLKYALRKHMLVHKTEVETPMYQCSECSYKTNRKDSLMKHELIHKNVFKCDNGEFETNQKRFLVQHKLAHKTLETHATVLAQALNVDKTFKCENCNYQSKIKYALRKHMLVHKTEGETPMYQCSQCEFKSKRAGGLRRHIEVKHTVHLTTYSCYLCAYQTKIKKNLYSHIKITHLTTKSFKCDRCSFEAKHKKSLTRHMLLPHEKVDTVGILKCTECNFQTEKWRSLKMHMDGKHQITNIQDQNSSRIPEIFRCADCSFQTKLKDSLRKHVKLHRSERWGFVMFRCNFCEFGTKGKWTMQNHLKRHVKNGEVKEGEPAWTKEKIAAG